ncbi:MAG: methylmalonyl Co-A mutase-associated GTPase MeaB [Thermoleophilia bacterium]
MSTAGGGALADAVRRGDRSALARAITLVESTRADHRRTADALLQELLPHTGGALRLGITGSPGVGKSSLIETLGLHLVDAGLRLAVLAVDPSSARGGGSILGDKTRMAELSRRPEAFIRPSPAGTTLGGVARRTREALLLCEAWGADVVIVETVGVGQSETAVAGMTDLFLLLVAPGGGDELQGIKRGIMELADLVAVNKADGDLRAAAGRAVAAYRGALALMVPRHAGLPATAVAVSAHEDEGVHELWQALCDRRDTLRDGGALRALRAHQAVEWMWWEVRESLLERARGAAGPLAARLEHDVAAGGLMPHRAAQDLIAAVLAAPGPAGD